MQRSDRRLRCSYLDYHSVHAREYRCDVQQRQTRHEQVHTATCASDKTAHGATCAVKPDAGYSGGSLTCNGVTGAYVEAASTTTACTPGNIDATYNTDNKASSKFEATCAGDETAHGATCVVTATDGHTGGSLTCDGSTGKYVVVPSEACATDCAACDSSGKGKCDTCSVGYKRSSDNSACATTACTPSGVDGTYNANNQGTNKFTATCASDKTAHGATYAVKPDAG